jgi:hypothetical protein
MPLIGHTVVKGVLGAARIGYGFNSDNSRMSEEITVGRLRELLLDGDPVSLDGERDDETYVLENRGHGWLVFFLERGRKQGFRKHSSEDAACRDLLERLGR